VLKSIFGPGKELRELYNEELHNAYSLPNIINVNKSKACSTRAGDLKYEGESNENRKNFFKFNLLNESGTQLYHFST
jgi:hypothetical protein